MDASWLPRLEGFGQAMDRMDRGMEIVQQGLDILVGYAPHMIPQATPCTVEDVQGFGQRVMCLLVHDRPEEVSTRDGATQRSHPHVLGYCQVSPG